MRAEKTRAPPSTGAAGMSVEATLRQVVNGLEGNQSPGVGTINAFATREPKAG